jgi:hypothetical protein
MDYPTEYYQQVLPNELARHTLGSLSPSPKSRLSEELQSKIIEIMRADPTAGYTFLSDSGWSKTTFLSALFHEAVYRHPDDLLFVQTYRDHPQFNGFTPVVMIDAADLMDQIQRSKFGGERPIISVWAIERMMQRGIFFTLILDEFEKIRKTTFRMEESYKILNACYKARGKCQVVIAGNLTKEDLKDKNQYLEGTFRRIEELTLTKEGKSHFWEFGGKR